MSEKMLLWSDKMDKFADSMPEFPDDWTPDDFGIQAAKVIVLGLSCMLADGSWEDLGDLAEHQHKMIPE